MTPSPSPSTGQVRATIAYCARPAHLRRTTRIAAVVGLVLTAVNQGAIIAAGDATTVTWLRCAVNFLVPFVVSNLGLLTGRPRSTRDPATLRSGDDER